MAQKLIMNEFKKFQIFDNINMKEENNDILK